MLQESSSLRERLLIDFSPDDACPLGAQLSPETAGNIYQSGLKDDKDPDMVPYTALLLLFFLIPFYFNLRFIYLKLCR